MHNRCLRIKSSSHRILSLSLSLSLYDIFEIYKQTNKLKFLNDKKQTNKKREKKTFDQTVVLSSASSVKRTGKKR